MTLIDESYNANPASMRAALALLASAPGRKLAALGDMLELGDAGGAAACGARRAGRGRRRRPGLHGRGRDAASARHAAGGAARRPCRRAEDLLPLLEAELQPGDTLLVKGSLGIGMGRLVAALLRRAGAP